ncbi:hypothetical protein F5148DRAFT_142965 [Russula earlei]|uniref:Uncharacterized protein n=1 Tax=Russula earlei TaxID=71964 RepID=A0ACC0U6D4_9AGAM|nr:hypothetical protein F5148DRAFT_142965 [Russula earlei]
MRHRSRISPRYCRGRRVSLWTMSTLDSPLTGDFGNISLYPAPLVGPSDISPEMTVITSDGEGSPAVSNSSSTRSGNPPLAQGMSSFRRHSIGEASALSVCAIVQKTKRGVSEEDVSFEVKGEADVHHGLVSGAGVYKHSRSVMGVSAASAPAIFSVPLPEVEQGSDDAETGSVDRNSSEPFDDLAFGSPAPSSIPSPAPSIPAPAFDSAPATSSSTSGQRRPRARRRSGATSRQKRTPCEYCTKTFSRIQDAQRHIATSCNASPKKMGVECPKCGSVLSRLDAAQRHWRQNRACAPPEWADHA